MEVFISWSGERSEKVAKALHDWLPNVIQSLRPFMSAADIKEGSRWATDIATHLEQAKFGLLCLTPENLEAPWLLFEAGALSKTVESAWVVPYLYKVSPTELQGPLTQFQAATADKDSTKNVMATLNSALGDNKLEEARLKSSFENWWPKLEISLNEIQLTTEEAVPIRSERDILEEILDLVRSLSRQVTNLPTEPSPELLRQILERVTNRETRDGEDFDRYFPHRHNQRTDFENLQGRFRANMRPQESNRRPGQLPRQQNTGQSPRQQNTRQSPRQSNIRRQPPEDVGHRD